MQRSLLRCTIRLSPLQKAKLDEVAALEKRNCSDVIRAAIDAYVANGKPTESQKRHLRVSEYAQLALDWIIQQDHPEIRERLIAEADRRMGLHHGA